MPLPGYDISVNPWTSVTFTFTFTFTFGAGAVKLPSAEAVLSSAQCASPVWPKVKVSS